MNIGKDGLVLLLVLLGFYIILALLITLVRGIEVIIDAIRIFFMTYVLPLFS